MLARAACFIAFAACTAVALPAVAQTAIFTESWESGATRWRTSDSVAISLASDSAPVCSTKFQRETSAVGGGRVFTLGTAVANQIPVVAGMPYCVSAWIRGATGTVPFLGFNVDDGSGAAAGVQHWMIGDAATPNGYGQPAVQVTADGKWRWYAAPFTPEAGATFIVLTDELWEGGGMGAADFDDLQVWQGACPTAAPGVDAHATCAGATPSCSSASGACVECTSGSTGACAAGGKGSICLPAESCGCTADAHCGGGTSGRICNLALNVCAAGCRGPGGNGCPAGMVCSSSDSSAGSCAAAVAPDLGGVPDLGMPMPQFDDLGYGADLAVLDPGTHGVAGGGGCDVGRGGDGAAVALLGLAALFALSRRRRRWPRCSGR
ncbi:MAG: putative internalin [Myxococcales bacterium]|nr:putative internalin [Myxococcales bacterium]